MSTGRDELKQHCQIYQMGPFIFKSLLDVLLSCGILHLHFCTCLALHQIRFFVLVMKMQLAKFSSQFDPTQVIKCLPACHSAILYILCLQLSTLLMNYCVWRLPLGFRSKVVTQTTRGKFRKPSVYSSAVFCS